ncbi:EamA family transporter [filamentous cyanobacterium CCP5]|nr:EamA family transporter [filamentous cyanobacterium CCP5]
MAGPKFHVAISPATLQVLLAMGSTQLGSALAKSLFGQVGPVGMATLRVGFAALVLMVLWRPKIRGYSRQGYYTLVLFGLSLAAMNTFFYGAIARIPIGVGVALEFTGPLVVALFNSQRRLDFVWVLLAAIGIVLLAPFRGSLLDPVGVILALLAGACWGAYILLSAQTGRVFEGSQGLALAMTVGAIALLPLGIITDGGMFGQPVLLAQGFGVALLASALPYSLEMAALRHLPLSVFGVFLSLEPAIAACLGFWLLGETLALRMVIAIAMVMIAAAGIALSQKPVG